jgi:hypothetical protein
MSEMRMKVHPGFYRWGYGILGKEKKIRLKDRSMEFYKLLGEPKRGIEPHNFVCVIIGKIGSGKTVVEHNIMLLLRKASLQRVDKKRPIVFVGVPEEYIKLLKRKSGILDIFLINSFKELNNFRNPIVIFDEGSVSSNFKRQLTVDFRNLEILQNLGRHKGIVFIVCYQSPREIPLSFQDKADFIIIKRLSIGFWKGRSEVVKLPMFQELKNQIKRLKKENAILIADYEGFRDEHCLLTFPLPFYWDDEVSKSMKNQWITGESKIIDFEDSDYWVEKTIDMNLKTKDEFKGVLYRELLDKYPKREIDIFAGYIKSLVASIKVEMKEEEIKEKEGKPKLVLENLTLKSIKKYCEQLRDRWYNPLEVDVFIDREINGEKVVDVAEKYGLSQRTIYTYVNKVYGNVGYEIGKLWEQELEQIYNENNEIENVSHRGNIGEYDFLLLYKDGLMEVVSAKCYMTKDKTIDEPLEEFTPEIEFFNNLKKEHDNVKLINEAYSIRYKRRVRKEIDLDRKYHRIIF